MPKQDDFLPSEYVDIRLQRRTNFISLTLFIVVLGGVISAYLVTDRQRVAMREQQQLVARQFTRAAQQLEELERLQKQKEEMLRKADVTAQLTERPNRTLILSELINRMPPTLSLLSFDMRTRVDRRAVAAARTAMERERARTANNRRRPAADNTATTIEIDPTELTIELIGVAPTNTELSGFLSVLNDCEMYSDVNMVLSERTVIENQNMIRFRIEMKVNQGVDLAFYEPIRIERHLRQNPMSPTMRFEGESLLVTPPSSVSSPD